MKVADFDPLLVKYRRKGVLLDSNLLLLLFVGRFAPAVVGEFKLLTNQGFTLDDFKLLREVVSAFSKIVTTPHILTEVSNQCGMYRGRFRPDLMKGISALVQQFDEQSAESKEIVRRSDFAVFGLTDCVITALTAGRYLVLTKDFPLIGHLKKNGVEAVNFTHLRALRFGIRR